MAQMTAQLISGREIADQIRTELSECVKALKEEHGVTPGLATVLVGDDPASHMYVGMKNKAAAAMGIHSRQITLGTEASEDAQVASVAFDRLDLPVDVEVDTGTGSLEDNGQHVPCAVVHARSALANARRCKPEVPGDAPCHAQRGIADYASGKVAQ